MSRKRKANGHDDAFDPFVRHHRSMLASDAWRALSPRAVKLLSCLEYASMSTKGNQNGRLPISYAEFIAWGVGQRAAVSAAIKETVQAGFLEVTVRGRMVGRKPRRSLYHLTYLPTADRPATDDWRQRFENRTRSTGFENRTR